jgi:TatD DNase family protein
VSLVDTHCHLDDEKFDPDREQVIERALAAGVELMMAIGTGGELDVAIRQAERYPFIYATVGVHPHDASTATPDTFARLRDLAGHPKVLAIGEIGLDYHYDFSPRDVQRSVFDRQLELAAAVQKPIVIHTREAWEDTMAQVTGAMTARFGTAANPLAEVRENWLAGESACPTGGTDAFVCQPFNHSGCFSASERGVGALPHGGIMHCFTGDAAQARQALTLGFHLSFGGVLTFPKAESVREAASITPEDRLLVETDCPYLAPVPHRGKRNEPAFVVDTARRLAQVRGTTLEAIAACTTRNFRDLCLRGQTSNG